MITETIPHGKTGVAAPAGRLYFVQWRRVFLVSLVVAHHAGQPYGPTGGEWPVDDPVSSPWLGAFFAFNAAFFMGFFFLIAGYFVGGSYDRKGGVAYVRGRLARLGIPLAFVTLFVFGPIAYLDSESPTGFLGFFVFDYVGRGQFEMGHLWFLALLLAFCLLYAVWRGLPALSDRVERCSFAAPTDRLIMAYAIVLGVVGAIVRSVYPQDEWVRILWLIPVEPAHLPQYLSLFVIGIIAGRGRWFVELSSALGARWFVIGVAAFVIARVFPYQSLPVSITQDMAWGFLEAFVCVGIILGLSVTFRQYFNKSSQWLSGLDDNVYGVYIIHVFVLVGLQSAITGLDLPALAKFAIVTAAGLIISFGLSAAIRRVPGVARVV